MRPHAIFVHGMWSRPLVWQHWIAAFEAAGYACTAVALPGHGDGSVDRDLDGLSIRDYADAVAAVAAAHERPVVIGHSMGGLIAQLVATRKTLAAAVLINSAAPAPVFPLRPQMLPGLVRHFATWGVWRSAFRLNAWEARYLLLGGLEAAEAEAVRASLIAESGLIAYELGFGSLNLARSNFVDRTRVACPLLALAGERDRIVPLGVSRAMAAYYGAQMDFRAFAGRAHWLLGEAGYEARIDDALQWLERVVAA